MREILFRGKRIDNGEWVYSQTVFQFLDSIYIPAQNLECTATRSLNPVGNISVIKCNRGNYFFKVQSETVGQYTGLTDKNGKKIFIDDIVEAKRPPLIQRGVVTQLSDGLYVFKGEKYHDLIDFKLEDVNLERCLSAIGNIHDNPELLEVGE